MSFNVESLPGCSAFGAMVTGLAPEAIQDPEVRKRLYDLWIDKGVIVFKGLSDLDTQIHLSEIYGEPEIHPLLVGIDRPREHFVIAEIEYVREDGDLYELNGELRGGYLWPNTRPGLGVDIDEAKAAKYPITVAPVEWTQSRWPDGTIWTP